ncbi:MAG: CIA30 family protein, partial [bacterium]
HIHGHLGLNQSPWTWAQLRLDLVPSGSPQDLGPYQSVRFWAKGDGRIYQVRLIKRSVADSDHFGANFMAGPEWTLVQLPLSAFRQAGWGKPLDHVFNDVTSVDFSPLAHDSDFDLSVSGVVLSARPAFLKPRRVDTRGWWVYPGVDPVARKGTALDAGFLEDAPAGKHGRVESQGEGFVFDDGKPVRFFGVNLVASCNFPSHAQADAMAELLSEMGVNLTRHHHLEATWSDRNIFGSDSQTLALDPKNMDRFDYLVAALQKKGIYQYFDLLVSRKALASDGVADPADLADGWKIMAEFAPDLLPLESRFITEFLGHRNPYTGRRYADDPGVAMMETINEDSMFY